MFKFPLFVLIAIPILELVDDVVGSKLVNAEIVSIKPVKKQLPVLNVSNENLTLKKNPPNVLVLPLQHSNTPGLVSAYEGAKNADAIENLLV
jgi:hypothetical protein